MKILIKHLLKKTRSGGYAKRNEVIEAPSIRFGRGSECEVHLTDPRILLFQLEITERSGKLHLESQGDSDFQVNDQISTKASVKSGDKVQIGAYDIEILGNEEGFDAIFTLEHSRPLGDELTALKKRSNTKFTTLGLSIRGWSWLLFTTVIIIGILGPLTAFIIKPKGEDPLAKTKTTGLLASADRVWLSGPHSSVHAHFSNRCETCHTNAFKQVMNRVCFDCHDNAGHHADPSEFPGASLDGQQCQNCHKEHTGDRGLLITTERFCTNCHNEILAVAENSKLKNVSDFDEHPQFRPMLIKTHQPQTFERVAIDGKTPRPIDRSNLKFSHNKHLKKNGVRHPDGTRTVLNCGFCHKPETGGIAIQPISFEKHCSNCHDLKFEPQAPNKEMPHRNISSARDYILGTYAEFALRGNWIEPAATTENTSTFRKLISDKPVTKEEKKAALDWAETKAEEILQGKFGRGLCGECHEIVDNEKMKSWDVAPVFVPTKWLPKSYFNHKPHKDRKCTTCHAAKNSEEATDVLLPSVETCQECHGGEFTTTKVRSTCTECHSFHREDLMMPKETL
jgi:predicted CXXCH cytochrome family protein